MNLIIDGRMIEKELHGIGRYTYELVRRLVKEENVNIKLLTNNETISKEILGENNIEYIRIKSKFLSPFEVFELPIVINKYSKDHIFHSPSFSASPFIKNKSVITIHDLNHLKLPQYYSKFHKYYYKFIVRPFSLKCEKILTVSNFSKMEIVEWLKCSPNNVVVTYNGIDKKFKKIDNVKELEHIKNKYSLPDKFILYVGNLKPHKDVKTLIKSIEGLNLNLVISGKSNELIDRTIEVSDLKEYVKFIGYIDDNDLPKIYNLADLFVFPSLYEGFGLPPLEAMASGCPTIVSSAACLQEVVGDNKFVFKMEDYEELSKKINEVMDNEKYRNDLIDIGINRAKLYSWDKCYNETLEVYKNILGYEGR